MTRLKSLLLGGAASIVFGIGTAVAAPITLVDSTGPFAPGPIVFGTIPSAGTNQLAPLFGATAAGPLHGYFGASVSGILGRYRIDVFGAEAGFRNQFAAPGGTVRYTHPGGTVISANLASPRASFLVDFAAGLLDFRFVINSGTTVVHNSTNPNDRVAGAPQNFFASFAPGSITAGAATRGNGVFLFLDDGAVVDDNHDDLLVRVTYVPEPASLALLGAGLLGLGFAARRRKAA